MAELPTKGGSPLVFILANEGSVERPSSTLIEIISAATPAMLSDIPGRTRAAAEQVVPRSIPMNSKFVNLSILAFRGFQYEYILM